MPQTYTNNELELLVQCIRSGQIDAARVAQLLQHPQVAEAYAGQGAQ
jgi:hypothetical protein